MPQLWTKDYFLELKIHSKTKIEIVILIVSYFKLLHYSSNALSITALNRHSSEWMNEPLSYIIFYIICPPQKATSSWLLACLVAKMVKNLPAMQETWVWSLGQEDPLEKGMATHSNILAWKITWTEKPGGLQSIGSQRVRHDWAASTHTHIYKVTQVTFKLTQV